MRKYKPEVMVSEYIDTFERLHPGYTVRLTYADGVMTFWRKHKCICRCDPKYFKRMFLSSIRKRADATHVWWKPGKVDEICRACGIIRGRSKEVCRAF